MSDTRYRMPERKEKMGFVSYKDLDIYKLAHALAIEIHAMSLTLPKFELYEEGSQIRRSAKSASSNIVEGFGRRRYKNEFIKFLVYSLASCDETKEHLEILFATKSLRSEDEFKHLKEKYSELGRKIVNFLKAVELQHR